MTRSLLLLVAIVAVLPSLAANDTSPALATGVRVGEVTQDAAIIWVRLTASSERLMPGKTHADVPAPEKPASAAADTEEKKNKQNKKDKKKYKPVKRSNDLPTGWRVDELEGACPAAPGEARVVYGVEERLEDGKELSWRQAKPENDMVLQFSLRQLRAGTRYFFKVETRSPQRAPGQSLTGSFRTAPTRDTTGPVTFTVVTGMMYRDLDDASGFHIYKSMGTLAPDFLVATGDTVYYDSEWPAARGIPLARHHWHRMYSLPRLVEFHRRVPGYWIKDDHDTLDNDCWPGKQSGKVAPLTFVEGQRIFREQVPMGKLTYRTVRWGKHLQVWIVEGRDFRSPNTMPDGPDKTIWGQAQIRWLKKTLLDSTATFKVLVSATPIVGPDRPRGKKDNHSNAAFHHEGEGFRRWVQKHLPGRFYVVCGDRHWQYHSVDPSTAVQEFSCGPASDKHAGGSPGLDSTYHKYHRVMGGFLSVRVAEQNGRPHIAFRFHDVHGKAVHEYREDTLDEKELAMPLGEPAPRTLGNPLYERLLDEARELLGRRAEEVGSLVEPSAIEARRQHVRQAIIESLGGFPERTPLNARVVKSTAYDDYRMERIVFESQPGFHVTANLYLPKKSTPPYPVILFPCGHSTNGKGGSTYQVAGQELARRGFAVFIYDPFGQGERLQFLDAAGKPIVRGTDEHTLTGAAALLVGSSSAAVIIWDGIRAVDYLASREDLDLERLGCTGNSGGGTQTSYLMALEPRIRVAAPSCYLTTFTRLLETIGPQDAEQNFPAFIANGLDHADFVLAFSPRPALLCAATRDFFDIGGTWTTFREAKRIYGRLGVPEAVDLIEIDAKHGYHPAIRQRVGRFLEAHLLDRALGDITPAVKEGKLFSDAELQCTETGQVVTTFRARTVADLWKEREARLRPQRSKRFEEMSRADWLEGVRTLTAMQKTVPVPKVRVHGTIELPGVTIEKLSWDQPCPVSAMLFGSTATDQGKSITIFASETPIELLSPRLIGMARNGDVVLALRLPGSAPQPTNRRQSFLGVDWKHAFLALHLGRSLAGIRADALRQAAAFMRARHGGKPVRLIGVKRAAVPALLAAVLDPAIQGVRLEEGLESWAAIVESGLHRGRLGNVVHGALGHFDLPLLRRAMAPRPIEVIRPVNPMGEPVKRYEF